MKPPSAALLMARMRRKLKHPNEAAVQAKVMTYLRLRGCHVMTTSQGYRKEPGGTRMTPGIPDLLVWLPNGRMGWFEVKSHDGMLMTARMLGKHAKDVNSSALSNWRRVMAQEEFARRCRAGGVPYARGGLEEAIHWMEESQCRMDQATSNAP